MGQQLWQSVWIWDRWAGRILVLRQKEKKKARCSMLLLPHALFVQQPFSIPSRWPFAVRSTTHPKGENLAVPDDTSVLPHHVPSLFRRPPVYFLLPPFPLHDLYYNPLYHLIPPPSLFVLLRFPTSAVPPSFGMLVFFFFFLLNVHSSLLYLCSHRL